jgi:hypothetical protein
MHQVSKAILAFVRLSEGTVRTGLRFPIFDVAGRIIYVGGVGANMEPPDLSVTSLASPQRRSLGRITS